MRRLLVPLSILALLLGPAGCIGPKDQRPGLWLSGESTELPESWAFTDDHREVALEVRPPYLVPHSVTIWCASVDGRLYVAARSPDEKRWPGWADRRPDVRLGIDGKLYDVRLAQLSDESQIEPVRRAYAAKYEIPVRKPGEGPPMRYWAVEARSGS